MDWVNHVFVASDGTRFVVTERVLDVLADAPGFPALPEGVVEVIMALADVAGEIKVVGVCETHGEATWDDRGVIICRDCGGVMPRR